MKTLRVLWTTNTPLEPLARHLGRTQGWGGSWMNALLDALKDHSGLEVGVVAFHPSMPPGCYEVEGRTFHILRATARELLFRPSPKLIGAFAQVAQSFDPDLIHVHGTEFTCGEVALEACPGLPVVASIQGLLHRCAEVYDAGLPLWDRLRFRSLRDWISLDGMLEQQWKWRRRGQREKALIRRLDHVMGRTLWDRAHTHALQPHATYHMVPELIREAFWRQGWTPEGMRPHTLFVSSADYPLKGFHVLLEAAALLRGDFPDLQIRVAGSQLPLNRPLPWKAGLRAGGYAHLLRHRIQALGMEESLAFLGPLDEEGMAQELCTAHAFVLPSFLENSPNALSEAMLLGVPSIASHVGGIPSGRCPGVDHLSFSAGDAAQLAEQVRRIFNDPALAGQLSEAARRQARTAHDPSRILEIFKTAYHEIKTANIHKVIGGKKIQ